MKMLLLGKHSPVSPKSVDWCAYTASVRPLERGDGSPTRAMACQRVGGSCPNPALRLCYVSGGPASLRWKLRRKLPHPCSSHLRFGTCTMGALLTIPFAGVFGTVASSCLAGLAFCFTSTAGQSDLVRSPWKRPVIHVRKQRPCSASHVTATHLLQLALGLL